MPRPDASVIIVARDEEKNLAKCLPAVKDQDTGLDYEILVVDSGSTDDTAKVARSFGARVITMPRDSFQHGRTRQMASEQARGEFLVYLVADAVPADGNWLSFLVDAVASDDRVAGAYSRQVPRDGAGPAEAFRMAHRRSSGTKREVRETGAADLWALSPEERFSFCEFDDVSCCRRASLLESHPIPEVEWAEDLLWAKQVLLDGYRIVFEPRSVVKHSHQYDIVYSFRRGYLDQRAVRESFGVLYFDGVTALVKGLPRVISGQWGAVMRAPGGPAQKAKGAVAAAARAASEAAGNCLAVLEKRRRHVACDLRCVLGRGLGAKSRGSVLLTRFTLGSDTRKVLFMNPDAMAKTRVKIPHGASLTFAAGINPAARPLRAEPVLFAVTLDGEPVWHRWIGPGERGREPAWTEAEVDLASWGGQRIEIALVTHAPQTDHAWAGWAEPAVTVGRLSWADRAVNRLIDRLEETIGARPLRHV